MQPLTVVPTATAAAPTAIVRRSDGRELFLHSRINPREEAEFLVADIEIQERTLYVVLGFGLGYHLDALLRRLPASSHIAVVEPAAAPLSPHTLAPSIGRRPAWTEDPRLQVLAQHDPALTATHLADHLTARHLLSITIVPHLPSMQIASAYYGALMHILPQALPDAIQQQLNLMDKMLEGDLRNFWANLSSSWNEASVNVLRGQWTDRPLVIVSGGPSLTAQLEDLRLLRDRALVLATGSTARTLIDRGITPDAIISVDPYDLNLAHFVGWDGTGIPLIYYHRIHCGIPRVYTGPMAAFRMHDEPTLPLLGHDRASAFSRGGTVAFSALQFGHLLGANPIVFVGQDFAFAGGRTHAEGAIYNETFPSSERPADAVEVPGVGETPVVTSRLLHAYLLHMQNYLLQVGPRRPELRHINTPSIGARIQGTTEASLRDTLGPLPAVTVSPRDELTAALQIRAAAPAKAQKQLLDRWISELQPLVTDAERATPDQVFERLEGTSLYATPGRGYADLRYVWETKYQRGAHDASPLFTSRLRHHLRQVLDDLRHESATL